MTVAALKLNQKLDFTKAEMKSKRTEWVVRVQSHEGEKLAGNEYLFFVQKQSCDVCIRAGE